MDVEFGADPAFIPSGPSQKMSRPNGFNPGDDAILDAIRNVDYWEGNGADLIDYAITQLAKWRRKGA